MVVLFARVVGGDHLLLHEQRRAIQLQHILRRPDSVQPAQCFQRQRKDRVAGDELDSDDLLSLPRRANVQHARFNPAHRDLVLSPTSFAQGEETRSTCARISRLQHRLSLLLRDAAGGKFSSFDGQFLFLGLLLFADVGALDATFAAI